MRAKSVSKIIPKRTPWRSWGGAEQAMGDLLRAILEHPWALLGPYWAHLGPSWVILDSSWSHLGAIAGHLEAILGQHGAVLEPFQEFKIGRFLEAKGGHFGGVWEVK